MLANSRLAFAIVAISLASACSGGSNGGPAATGGAGGTGATSGGGSGGSTSGGAGGSVSGGAAGSAATGGAAGSGTGGAAGSPVGGAGGSGGSTTFCPPNSSEPCYSGPPGTADVGVCHAGTHTCDASGSAWGVCNAEVLPSTQSCGLPVLDDDCDGQLGAGCCVSGAWTSEIVDASADTGMQNRIGVDATGTVSIGYSELTQTSPTTYTASARFAYKPRGGSWSNETVSTAGSPATSVAFSLDPSGVGHEVYVQGTTPTYAIRTGTNSWSKYPAPSMGQSPNVVLDVRSGGTAHLVWRSSELRYASIDATGTKENIWIASSSTGQIHMAAHDGGNVYVILPTKACSGCSIGALVLYTKQPGGFSTLSLGTSTGFVGLAVDGAGDAHVVMSDSFGHFEYGTKKPGVPFSSAQCYVECPDPSGDPALAIDAKGQAHAAYVSGSSLRYVRRIGGSWQGETIFNGASASADVSIALDSAGGVHVSYVDATTNPAHQAYAYRCP